MKTDIEDIIRDWLHETELITESDITELAEAMNIQVLDAIQKAREEERIRLCDEFWSLFTKYTDLEIDDQDVCNSLKELKKRYKQ